MWRVFPPKFNFDWWSFYYDVKFVLEKNNWLHQRLFLMDWFVKDDAPKEVKIALEAFLEQSRIIVEYDLDNMPAEYMINLFRAISKYPQYDYLVDEILAIIISELGETV